MTTKKFPTLDERKSEIEELIERRDKALINYYHKCLEFNRTADKKDKMTIRKMWQEESFLMGEDNFRRVIAAHKNEESCDIFDCRYSIQGRTITSEKKAELEKMIEKHIGE